MRLSGAQGFPMTRSPVQRPVADCLERQADGLERRPMAQATRPAATVQAGPRCNIPAWTEAEMGQISPACSSKTFRSA
jgi:hypothetical protein